MRNPYESKSGGDSPEGMDEICQELFSRCSNWPKDRAGQLGLAQGLRRAADTYHVDPRVLATHCGKISSFCPTDADLFRVAGELHAEDERKKNGTPWIRRDVCPDCDGSGWSKRTVDGYDYAVRCPNGCSVPDQLRFGGEGTD